MQVSNELCNRVLAEYSLCEPKLNEYLVGKNSETKFVIFPTLIDGVMDKVYYNVAEKRFDQIAGMVAVEGIIESDMLRKGTAWRSEFEKVIIPLGGK